MLSSARRTLRHIGIIRPSNRVGAAIGVRSQSSNVDADAKSQAAKQWTPVVDPFTSAMQSQAEKELLDQVLRQAEQQEQAEDAAEQVSVQREYVVMHLGSVTNWRYLVHVIEQTLLHQERIKQRGEHGGPKGQEPTRFGEL